ncbi:MAG: AAA family ATPase, partial [Chromatiales bacterium]|nr:AAA family ATPase [Chromatiales bacterium]
MTTATDSNELPFYKPQGNEVELFEHAYRHQLPVLIKGPTGCGKTRFIHYMAAKLSRPVYTVACPVA